MIDTGNEPQKSPEDSYSNSKFANKPCFKCNQEGHWSGECPNEKYIGNY
jgi:hypothetical protein